MDNSEEQGFRSNVPVRVDVITPVYYTEDIGKVRLATLNVVSISALNLIRGSECDFLTGGAKGTDPIEPLRQKIGGRNLARAVSTLGFRSGDTSTVTLLFNKQSAYAGRLILSSSKQESALGPITVTIRGTDGQEFSNWIKSDSSAELRQRHVYPKTVTRRHYITDVLKEYS